MLKYKGLLLIVIMAVILSACTAKGGRDPSLANTRWKCTDVDGTEQFYRFNEDASEFMYDNGLVLCKFYQGAYRYVFYSADGMHYDMNKTITMKRNGNELTVQVEVNSGPGQSSESVYYLVE